MSHDEPTPTTLDGLIAQYLRAIDGGQALDRAAFLASHSDHAAGLQSFFRDQDHLERIGADPDATLAPDPPGADAVGSPVLVRYFGDYELLEEIARGGMGVVYKARQVSLNRLVALKMILSGQLASPQDVQRFHAEAEAAANLDHPNILPIYEVGVHKGQHYFSMKLVEGGNLAQSPRTAVSGRVETLARIARAVHFAHQRGILHRDLKPANVLVDQDGTPYVTDFGLAKRTEGDSGLTQSGAIVGTPSYMAPEQARSDKQLTTGVDVYALGAILYETLTGRPPFKAATPVETVLQVLELEPASPRSFDGKVDRDLETIALKSLEKDPAKRYTSAAELADELERWQRGEPIHARPAGRVERVWRWCQRNPVVASLSAAVVISLVAGTTFSTIFAVRSGDQARRADDEAATARTHEQLARASEDEAQRYLYAAKSQLVSQAWEATHLARFNELLREQVPKVNRQDLRGFEWYYFRHLTDRTTRLLLPRSNKNLRGDQEATTWTPNTAVALSPDGQRLAVGWEDLQVFDVASGRKLFTIAQGFADEQAHAIAFSPDSTVLATVRGPSVALLDATTGQLRKEVPTGKPAINALAYDRDGKRLAMLTRQKQEVTVIDVETGQTVRTLTGSEKPADRVPKSITKVPDFIKQLPAEVWTRVAFVANGSRIAVINNQAGWSGTIAIWDIETSKEVLRLGNTRPEGFSVSRDGRFVSGIDFFSKDINVWSVADGKVQQTINSLDTHAHCTTLTADGKSLAIGEDDGRVSIWDLAGRRKVKTFRGHDKEIVRVAFSTDGESLLSAGKWGAIRVWEAWREQSSVKLDAGFPGGFNRVVYNSTGNLIAASQDSGGVTVWDAKTRKRMWTVGGTSKSIVFTVAFSPDGKLVAGGCFDGVVRLWGASDGQLSAELKGHKKMVLSLSFSPDGGRLASAGEDKEIRVWDVAQRQLLVKWSNELKPGVAVTFSPDGRLIASMPGAPQWSDNRLLIWDATTGELLRRIDASMRRLARAAFSPDGAFIASTAYRSVKIWDTNTGALRQELKCPADSLTGIAYSNDGRRIVAGGFDSHVYVWDVSTGQQVVRLDGHTGPVIDVAISPDGRQIVSGGGSADRTIRLWDGTPPTP